MFQRSGRQRSRGARTSSLAPTSRVLDPFEDLETVGPVGASGALDDTWTVDESFPEVPQLLTASESWRVIGKGRFFILEAAHLLEARAIVRELECAHAEHRVRDCRQLFLVDSKCDCLAFERSRAQSYIPPACTHPSIRSPPYFVLNVQAYFRWIPSEWNPADAPSREATSHALRPPDAAEGMTKAAGSRHRALTRPAPKPAVIQVGRQRTLSRLQALRTTSSSTRTLSCVAHGRGHVTTKGSTAAEWARRFRAARKDSTARTDLFRDASDINFAAVVHESDDSDDNVEAMQVPARSTVSTRTRILERARKRQQRSSTPAAAGELTELERNAVGPRPRPNTGFTRKPFGLGPGSARRSTRGTTWWMRRSRSTSTPCFSEASE